MIAVLGMAYNRAMKTAARPGLRRACCLLLIAAAAVCAPQKERKVRKLALPLSLKGEVYLIEPGTSQIPDFTGMKPATTVTRKKLNITPRDADEDLPGIRDRFEWYAIDFKGTCAIKKPGTYVFRLTSDDGSKLFLDDKLVIDNDGLHPPQTAEGEVTLDAGEHRIRVQYFQGPGGLALVLDAYFLE